MGYYYFHKIYKESAIAFWIKKRMYYRAVSKESALERVFTEENPFITYGPKNIYKLHPFIDYSGVHVMGNKEIKFRLFWF